MSADDADSTALHTDFVLDGYEFLERQYFLASPQAISVNGEEDDLLFEAQLALHVPLYGRRIGKESSPELGWVTDARLLFTFLNRLRMTADRSTPVVTPSYMPRLRLQVLGRRVTGSDLEMQMGGTLMVAHHSNGQQGCTFRDSDGNTTAPNAEGDERCLSPAAADFLNEDGGSFSTNYWGVALNARFSFDAQPRRRSRSIYVSAAVEHHPEGFLSAGALDDDLFSLWGNVHLDAQVEGRLPLLVGADDLHRLEPYGLVELYWVNRGQDRRLPLIEVDDSRMIAEAGVVFPTFFRVGLFARGVFGREYYNIQFSQSRSRFQFGVVFDTSFGEIPPRVPRSGDPFSAPAPPPDGP